jgi:hypothetical protein
MLTGHARGREASQAKTLPIIDGHGLVSIWQEHDIPAHPRPLHPFAQIMNPTMLCLGIPDQRVRRTGAKVRNRQVTT